MKTRRRIAVLIESSNAYGRGLLRGVISYVREHPTWTAFYIEQGRGDAPSWLADWDGDGIIARIENQKIAKAILKSKVPVVDVSAARLVPSIPWVETDDAAIAKIVVEHFLERGFKNFAFCGDDRFNWSKWRGEHFQKALNSAGFGCSNYHPRESSDIRVEQQVAAIGQWLRGLPKPIGIMACYDIRADQVVAASRGIGIAVPDEVAVVGVDNDELLCNLCSPPLSSVHTNAHKAGYDAAMLLERIFVHKRIVSEAHLIEPLRLVVRQSSDVLAVQDREIAQAISFIREHACDGINVTDVLKAVPISRRALEGRFRKTLGITLHDEIARVKLNRVKQLLIETDLPLSEIAYRTGFEHLEYLTVFFKENTGIPPSHYRNKLTRSADLSRASF